MTLRSGRALAERKMNPRNNSPSEERIACSMDQEERTQENTSHSEPSTSNVGNFRADANIREVFEGHLDEKEKVSEKKVIALMQECNALVSNKLQQKQKDPGSFTVPCSIGGLDVGHALCDLGASINLMPLSVFKKLGIGEAQPISVTLQLVDRIIKYPEGKIEDVLVKVDNLIFPADFIILDYEADREVPIILGRPFLVTGKVLIDVHKGELTMRVDNEEVKFNVLNALKFPNNDDCQLNNVDLTEETRVYEVLVL
ncbi:uncharacterized protein LOC120084563 [Benincasa hispida]|uniref:uncharacterized protein LOC120084563 n=1 Tax=Benincasa hispida TaxID=102211 RepID=UPI001902A02A|nr:uncharacterized protein LOC120084563 [Benincasa hispida]